MRRPAALAAMTLVLVGGGAASAPAAPAPVTVRLDGVGPLKLGMARTAAVATGWLRSRAPGCELAGPPRPITYRFGGAAPAALRGGAEFRGGRLRSLTFTRGARTTAGVTVGVTTLARMVTRYHALGFAATSQYVSTFGGTFVTVRRAGHDRLGAFGTGQVATTLALPRVEVCE